MAAVIKATWSCVLPQQRCEIRVTATNSVQCLPEQSYKHLLCELSSHSWCFQTMRMRERFYNQNKSGQRGWLVGETKLISNVLCVYLLFHLQMWEHNQYWKFTLSERFFFSSKKLKWSAAAESNIVSVVVFIIFFVCFSWCEKRLWSVMTQQDLNAELDPAAQLKWWGSAVWSGAPSRNQCVKTSKRQTDF